MASEVGCEPEGLRDRARTAWRRALDEARQGVTGAAARFTPPAAGARLQRVAYGFGLPLALARTVLRDPATRRLYLRVASIQAATIIAIGVLLSVLTDGDGNLYKRGGFQVSFASSKAATVWSAFYATLCVVEWIVVAVSRDYHDEISRRASLLSGVPPEDGPIVPRVRVDLKWMWRKAKRRLRGLKVFACGIPAFAPLALIPYAGSVIYSVVAGAWAFYWFCVFTIGRTALAWVDEEVWQKTGQPAPDPWFLRRWNYLTERVFGYRWALPRWYGRTWRRLSTSAFPAAIRTESAPYEAAGLALARLLGSVPGLYVFVRPFVPVASAHALLARERAAEVTVERRSMPDHPSAAA